MIASLILRNVYLVIFNLIPNQAIFIRTIKNMLKSVFDIFADTHISAEVRFAVSHGKLRKEKFAS